MHPIVLTDLYFADDIALISDSVRQASELLQRVESECSKVGLLINYNKKKVMAFNTLMYLIRSDNIKNSRWTNIRCRKRFHIPWIVDKLGKRY